MGGARVEIRRGRLRSLAVAAWVAVNGLAHAADPPGTEASRAAVRLCHEAETAAPSTRADVLARAIVAAEAAVQADEGDALAHFAVFCALGERMRHDGVSVAAVASLRRLRREIDRTLELAPDFADALAGKGAFLAALPRLAGGDPVEAEALLRRALAVDPKYLGPRFDLAELLRDRGRRAEALAEARTALRVAEEKRSGEDVARATALVAALETR